MVSDAGGHGRLHLPKIAWLLNQIILHGLALDASARQPTRNGPLVEAEGDDDSLERTAVGEQRDHEGHGLGRGLQAVARGAFRGAERLVALGAEEALVLARVDTNVALACLCSGGAVQIGAECGCGVHGCPPRSALTCGKEEYDWPPVFIAICPYPGQMRSYRVPQAAGVFPELLLGQQGLFRWRQGFATVRSPS